MRWNRPLLLLLLLTAVLCIAGISALVEGIWLWPQDSFSELSSIRQVGPAVAAALQSSVARFATVGVGIAALLAGLFSGILTLHASAIASTVNGTISR